MAAESAVAPRAHDRVQLLDPRGERIRSSIWADRVDDIGTDALLALLRDMTVVRRLDTEATALQRQGELGLWPPLLGQEAAQIGSARALRADDFVFTSYRENGVAYCRGVRPEDLVPVWRGTTQSGWDPFAVNMATPQVVIGAQALHAVGYALGVQLDGRDAVAVAYFGDGATTEGDLSEALVFAVSASAPAVFFCQNNGWAISEPVGLQSPTPLADRARGFGMTAIQVDGNDVLAVAAVTRFALDHCRSGDGPVFIEAMTYRMGPHTTADDPTRYRDPGELALWADWDPIARVEAHLAAAGVLDEAARADIHAAADDAAARMRSGCVALRDPGPETLFDRVYAEPHPVLDAQRDAYARYLEGFR